MWRDPFLWMFVFMVLLDVGILLYATFRVKLFLKSIKTLPQNMKNFSEFQHETVAALSGQSLKDRIRDYQNRPV